ncbi:DUF2254 domain-containing protein [Pikeienuella piscinae]|uniref:DUF2254 domain-containing protein n=1 Tax=Pikeienuella piscinae TaxID=2748098 RepID=A0A7L5BU03_9RHOB|nr:DUF2254 family protein [Pikeienuella piscinae]QIE54088.1 DUF2254 domain-containing protein [Pikeienuella piscinae]
MRALLLKIGRLAPFRNFVTFPGLISLSGVVIAAATVWADTHLIEYAKSLGLAMFSAAVAQTVLSTLAGAAMTALSLVYSIVLVVFTLAAGNIGPRLLERFSQDRVNQIAVGVLGALFLHSLIALAFTENADGFFSVAAACILAVLALLLLLVFVDKVSGRVTIDEEIARIATDLDKQFAREDARVSGVAAASLVRIDGPETAITARKSGYINRIAVEALVTRAASLDSYVDFSARAGDHVLKGDRIGVAMAGDHATMAETAAGALTFGLRRTAEGDLRFSVNLLIEIALRALSPGVNDSYTAIACIDRLTASFARAAEGGVHSGVYCDAAGAARVFVPRSGLGDLIRASFDPLRRAARGNGLMQEALIRALGRLRPYLSETAQRETERQIALVVEEAEASDMLPADIGSLTALAVASGDGERGSRVESDRHG